MCPNCKQNAKAVKVVCFDVVVAYYHCECGARWKDFSFKSSVQLTAPALTNLRERVLARHSGEKSRAIMDLLEHLNGRIEELRATHVVAKSSFRKRRDDLWERRFLKEALGEDYQ